MTHSFYIRFGKRWFDVVCSFLGLLLLVPFLALLGILVWLSSGSPVFFRQVRTGCNGNPFRIWKFRSMRVRAEDQNPLLTAAGDDRVTPLGLWLRKSKFDELPQLINVLKGEMSLVGPRPEVPLYTQLYNAEQKEVLSVRPGVTGPSSNRYISEEELLASQPDKEAYYLTVLLPAKVEVDLAYCRALTFNTDLKLIANTFTNLLLKWRTDRPLVQDSPPKWL
ncbi:MAG TPA: sugar transferase [Candidatus Acidoferrum sp.]|jgi:lipopolysaccharide/colanic/teichoic acid biosynthesis glycosyltransferase